MQLYVGATLERPPGNKYVEALPFAELTFPGSLPKAKTLARWRESVPESFRVAIVVPHAAIGPARTPLRLGDDTLPAYEWLKEAMGILQADVVLPTGSGLSTSRKDRDRLEAYFDGLPDIDDRLKVWSPRGLWEVELAYPAAADMDVVCAFDPLTDPAPPSDVIYARVAAVGARRRLGEGILYELLEALIDAEPEQALVSLESGRSFQEAVALQALAAG